MESDNLGYFHVMLYKYKSRIAVPGHSNQLSHSVLTYEKGGAVTCVSVKPSALGQGMVTF